MASKVLYVIEHDEGIVSRGVHRLIIPPTGEIREAHELRTILASLVRDHGYYLRPVK
jgi:hypothetical protein